MGVYLQWPKLQFQQSRLLILIMIVFWSGLHLLGESLRHESDLNSPNKFCSAVSQQKLMGSGLVFCYFN